MENDEMTNDAAVAWRIRIGDSHTWGFTSDEDDADFHGKNSGLPYVKEPLVPATTVAELRAEAERLQASLDRLSGMKFSDRMHAALVSRADASERRVAELEGELNKLRSEWQASLGWRGAVVHGTRANIDVIADGLTKESP